MENLSVVFVYNYRCMCMSTRRAPTGRGWCKRG